MTRILAAASMVVLIACTSDVVFPEGAGTAGAGASPASSAASGGSGTASGTTSASVAAGGAMSSGGSSASGAAGMGGSPSFTPYGPCDANGNCPGGQTCIKGSPTPTSNVCAPPCMDDNDCPPSPGGTVTPQCLSPGPSCFLYGCGNASCPMGMSCGGVFCVWGL